MSDDKETDLNLTQLVGDLLAASNENIADLEDNGGHDDQMDQDNYEIDNVLPDLPPMSQLPNDDNNGDVDLASMVANAIQGMEGGEQEQEEVERDGQNEEQNKEQEWANILRQGILQADKEITERTGSHTNHAEQGLMENQTLDQDDEHLRLAILDSLQHLDEQQKSKKKAGKKEKKPKDKKKTGKKSEKDKKKKEKKTKEKKKSSSNDVLNFEDVIRGFMEQTEGTQTSTASTGTSQTPIGDAETQALVEATLKAFENQLTGGSTTTKNKAASSHKKATKASSHRFPKSLPPPLPMPFFPMPQKRKIKPKSAEKTVNDGTEKSTKEETDTIKKKKKSSKKKEKKTDDYNEDEFSKALAEMVNQVVNTSLADIPSSGSKEAESKEKAKATKKKSKSKSKSKSKLKIYEKDKGSEIIQPQLSEQPTVPSTAFSNLSLRTEKSASTDTDKVQEKDAMTDGHEEKSQDEIGGIDETGEEGFDLHQIMQSAMAMAFQDQVQNQLDSSVMEEFSRGLSEAQIPEGVSRSGLSEKPIIPSSFSIPKKKKKKSKKKKNEIRIVEMPGSELVAQSNKQLDSKLGSKIVVFKPQMIQLDTPSKEAPSREELLKKRYGKIAAECARIARRRLMEKRKKLKEHERLERENLKLQRKKLKEEQKERLEVERKELEAIVAKGPPYPSDIRLTSSGRPKKPYRRYTPEEIEKRASMSAEELGAERLRKERKKEKDAKMSSIPLYKLRKLSIFNPNPHVATPQLNDIEGSLEKVVGKGTVTKLSAKRENKWKPLREFDPTLKTVVHREKIPFHPPWELPLFPPFALPVARRHKPNHLNKMSRRKRALHQRMLVSNALVPILHTLRAAARATASAGVSPEESRQHLSSMLQQARLTIAETLQRARSSSSKDNSFIPSQVDKGSSTVKQRTSIPLPLLRIPVKVKEELPLETASKECTGEDVENEKVTNESKIGTPEIASAKDDHISHDSLHAIPKISLLGSKRPSTAMNDNKDIRENVTQVIDKLSTLIPSLTKATPFSKTETQRKKPMRLLNMDEVIIPRSISPRISSNTKPRLINLSNTKIQPIIKKEEETVAELPPSKRAKVNSMKIDEKDSLFVGEQAAKMKLVTTPIVQQSKKTEQFNKYTFGIPTDDAVRKTLKLTPMSKRIKKFLKEEDMAVLKKAKETYRKRKWRLANADKNKDLELRSRVKVAARKQFGEVESDLKKAWIEKEYNERRIKLELEPQIQSSSSSVVVTDHEVLNIIAISLGKLDLARAIENDIKEEVSQRNKSVRGSVNMRTQLSAQNLKQSLENSSANASTGEPDQNTSTDSKAVSSHALLNESSNSMSRKSLNVDEISEQSIDPDLSTGKRARQEDAETEQGVILDEDQIPKKRNVQVIEEPSL